MRRDPADADANAMMAYVLSRQGRPAQAAFYGERALLRRPGDPNILNNLGSNMLALGDTARALQYYERALEADPQHVSALVGITDALLQEFRVVEALRRATEGLERLGDDPRLIANQTAALSHLGRAREAVRILREAIRRHPHDVTLAAALAWAMNYADGMDRQEHAQAHRRCAFLIEREFVPLPARPADDPHRRLRVGIMSCDLRYHAVAFFAEPFFRLGEGFETWTYFTGLPEGEATERFRRLADHWRDVPHLRPTALARQIREDRIDVLVDLAGLTQGHRLSVLCQKPAPVQVTAVGYPGTTGLTTMDWRLADRTTDPPELKPEQYGTERLWYLEPCCLAYRPMVEPADDPAEPANEMDRPVVFGSFNALAKVDDETIRMWARVLEATPGARLMIKALALKTNEAREDLRARLRAGGVDMARVEIRAPEPDSARHLAAYRGVDVALDTYPYNGTTTTCEALWMGVPTVTRAGDRTSSRMGASLLRTVGLEDLIAEDADQYVRIAAELARAAARRRALRTTLRRRLLDSPLGDVEGMGRRLGEALREMWRRACTGVPPPGPKPASL